MCFSSTGLYMVVFIGMHLVVPAGARREQSKARNQNKHKRLFLGETGALADGQRLYYRATATGAVMLEGVAVINPGGVSGIRCSCCDTVISCSQFEAHAG